MSENQAPASNKPLFKKGEVAVFPLKQLGTHSAYPISEGPKDGEKKYTTVFASLGAYELTAEDAGRLYLGEDITVNINKKDGSGQYEAILAARGIRETERPNPAGGVYKNRTLDVGMVFPAKRRADGELFGFKVEGVLYYKSVGPQSDPVELSAKDVLALAAGHVVNKGDSVISVGEIEDQGEKGKVARVMVAAHAESQGVEEDPMPDFGEEQEQPASKGQKI